MRGKHSSDRRLHNPVDITLPDSLAELSQLRSLDLSGNKLTTLPDSLAQLSLLQSLNLSENLLTALPDSLARLSLLQSLSVSRNQLRVLPDSLTELANLRELYLSHNQLTALPDSLAQLSQLQKLYLYDNKFTVIPDSLAQLPQLQVLYLDANKLTAVPDSVAQLSKLQRLDLGGNQLTALPDSLKNLPALTELYLHDNPELGLPLEVLGPTYDARNGEPAKPPEILDYYFRTRRKSRPLNEAKLILVGRGGVGKTTLMKRLLTGKFSRPRKTGGIDIQKWMFTLPGREKVQLNVWDFGGQEIMHSTHQFFLTERSVYLLVLSGREGREDEDAEYWLKIIESFGGDSPVLVVLNKQKEHSFDVNRGRLFEKYPCVKDFIKTDCSAGLGIPELHKAIQRETDRLDGLRLRFPAEWFDIKSRLSGMNENFLTLDEYRQICGKHGEKEGQSQEALAGHLHRLGIALNYRDDSRLRHMHVLNPHWVVTGVYRILNADQLAEHGGELRESDLGEILPKKQYPVKMHGYLLNLMRKFELCFSLPTPGRFLVPELLPKDQSKAAAEFREEECLTFVYDYGSTPIPEGLLPRFIVRSHAQGSGNNRWLTGVILEFQGARALVRAEKADKKVIISVDGAAKGRKDLLAIIRRDFESIHGEFKNLNPVEYFSVPGVPDERVRRDQVLACAASGEPYVQVSVGGKIKKVRVAELIDTVDYPPRKGVARVFVSYAHEDERFKGELVAHLKILERRGLIEVWHDRLIHPGDRWADDIDQNLSDADIVILLLSAHFVNSDYCWETERPKALQLQKNRGVKVIGVQVRDAHLSKTELRELQALPKDAKPIDQWRHKDKAWREVAEAIDKAAMQLKKPAGAK